jgi:3-hydroxyisobutyrate dehydrogenase
MSDAEQHLGVVGLGNLGRAVALNLLRDHGTLVVLDREPERQRQLEDRGAIAGDVESLARCEQLLFVVPDETAIWQVLRTTDDGPPLLSRLGARHTVIVLSTILPSAATELASAIHDQGARYLDAPVTGGAERAEKGDLTVLLGGEPGDVQAAGPLLHRIGSEQHLLGPVGAGSAAKLANQLIMFAALGGIQEALRLTRAHGVADDALLTAISSGTADTWVGRNWGFFDAVAADYDRAGVPLEQRPWSKDLQEVLAVAERIGTHLPLATVLSETVATELERHARETREERR